MKIQTLFVTKEQLIQILAAWESDKKIPKKGEQIIICWPVGTNPDTAIIKWSDKKSDYGDRLYSILLGMSSDIWEHLRESTP